jgi:predicted transcriptional regulator
LTAALTNKQELQLRDTFIGESQRTWTVMPEPLDEHGQPVASRVDGVNILARVQGPFFLVDGVSLNNRFYSKSLWESAIKKVQEKLNNGGLFGAIGHDQELDEKALAEGKFSHTVIKLWINENNVGMGEILILGTNAGQQLNVLLRAGMPLPVSSRAFGKSSGKTALGEDIIDADSFQLETFDFVRNPGVSSAYVTVMENLTPTKNEDVVMDLQKLEEKLELIHKLTEEKMGLQAQLTEALQANIALTTKAADQEKTIAAHEAVANHVEAGKELSEGLRKWLELEPLKAYALSAGLLDQSSAAPNAASFTKKMLGLTEAYAALGTPDELKAVKEANAAFAALGSLEELNKMFAAFEQYLEMGSIQELDKVLGLAEEYIKIGSPTAISEKLDAAQKLTDRVVEGKRKLAAQKISKEFGVDEEAVLEMVKKMGSEATINSLKKIKESSAVTKTYKVPELNKVEETVSGTIPEAPTFAGSSYTASVFENVKVLTPVPELTTPRATL